MLGSGWLTIRQAQEALDNGRLEEAHRLLCQPEVQGHKGASPLLRQIAKGLVERGEQHIRHDDPSAAWHDLRLAEKIAGSERGVARLRQALVRLGLAEAGKLLDAGEPARALETIAHLQQGAVRQAEIQLLEELAKGWLLAKELAGRGEFAMAIETIERVRRLVAKSPEAMERFRLELAERRPAFAALLVQLHEAIENKGWRLVVSLSDQILALAPHHAEARKARGHAWRAIEPTSPGGAAAPEEAPHSPRFLLWIDGAGGYLVCLGTRVTIGQAAPDVAVDVPLLADIARTHVALTRDTEGYFLEAVRSIQVNGERVDKALLHPGDRITLGACCQLQFRQPVPVSATARLDLVSGHRLPLAVDGVLLMADTVVLGPSQQAHVTMPDIRQPVILFRQKEGLGVRYAGNLVVDGQPCRERGTLGPTSRVQGDDFTFAVEPLSPACWSGE
jgi:hypothetical protein